MLYFLFFFQLITIPSAPAPVPHRNLSCQVVSSSCWRTWVSPSSGPHRTPPPQDQNRSCRRFRTSDRSSYKFHERDSVISLRWLTRDLITPPYWTRQIASHCSSIWRQLLTGKLANPADFGTQSGLHICVWITAMGHKLTQKPRCHRRARWRQFESGEYLVVIRSCVDVDLTE